MMSCKLVLNETKLVKSISAPGKLLQTLAIWCDKDCQCLSTWLPKYTTLRLTDHDNNASMCVCAWNSDLLCDKAAHRERIHACKHARNHCRWDATSRDHPTHCASETCSHRTLQMQQHVIYTVVHKKCQFIFDCNSHVSWRIFTILPSMEMAMNGL